MVKQEGFGRRGTHVREADEAGFGCLVRSGDGTLTERDLKNKKDSENSSQQGVQEGWKHTTLNSKTRSFSFLILCAGKGQIRINTQVANTALF